MIGFTNPGALWALVLVAGPVIVHLLRRHRAERVPFPSLRFVKATETAAVRLRLPSDLWLLLFRAGAVGLAALALAGPIVLTGSRMAQWNSLTARAIVVDTSQSMQAIGSSAAEASQAEADTAAYSVRIDAPDLADGLRRASAWLSSAPPARREVVMISDFQRGAVDDAAVRSVPGNVGRRFTRVGHAAPSRSIDGAPRLAAPSDSRRMAIDLTRETTAVTVSSASAGPASGLRVIGAAPSDEAVATLLRVVAAAGASAPAQGQPIAIRFTGSGTVAPAVSKVASGWMLDTILGVMSDPVAAGARAGEVPAPLEEPLSRAPYTVVLRREDGRPIVSAAAADRELLFVASGSPDSLFAAALTRAVLNARSRARGYGEHEIAVLPDAELAGWRRSPPPVGADAWRQASATDARWCWLLALAALGVEQWLRAQPRRRAKEMVRAAA